MDDDFGRWGGGVNRPGFERVVAAICEERVGPALAIEASRLAGDGRGRRALIDFCGRVGSVLRDEMESMVRAIPMIACRSAERRDERAGVLAA